MADREMEALLASIPDIADGRGRKALYIGASPIRAYLLGDLARWGWGTDILEIHPPNADFARRAFPCRDVVLGDVRDAATLLAGRRYGLALWWHGPEHIPREDLPATLAALASLSTLTVLSCPRGRSPQGPVDGNPHETHLWDPQPADFAALGLSAIAFPRPPDPDGILAWGRG
jgi:hypothetical protein